ncbi:MAG TPA: hypothetical protein VFR41_03625 [Acidimicrobiia bacterium]|nr:hypothetical protein [Acidimicrobiia bacterium]
MTGEGEREFLLRSLTDLERERADGNIDDDTYQLLHDDYTARAAAVIRGEPEAEEPERVSALRRALTIGGIVAFAALAAFGLARAVGERHPGQTLSGNSRVTPSTDPNSYDAHLARARAALAAQDGSGALEEYFAASKLEPTEPEPLTYIGWLSALQAEQTSDPKLRAQLLQVAHTSFDRAIADDKTYPDAYVFKGLVLYRIDHQPAAAIPMFQQFLLLAPQDHPMRQQVLSVLARAVAAASTTTSIAP